jgi:hypothetical protein
MSDSTQGNLDLDNNSIALAGEFAVLSQLALRGYDANLTLGHTKGVDILISDPKRNKMFKMEVKTHYRNSPTKSELFGHTLGWVMSDKHEKIIADNLHYCFVNIEQITHIFKFYIVPSIIVAKYVKEQHEYWLSTRKNDIEPTTMRRFRLGLDENGYNIETPIARYYENKWELT